MKIYTPLVTEGIQLFQPDFPDGSEFFIDQINGEPRAKTWLPKPVKIVFKYEKGGQRKESDASMLNLCANALVLRSGAVEKLRPFLNEHGELLSLSCADAELFVFNPTRIVDALDVEKSDVWRFPDGRLIDVRKYAFRAKSLGGVDVFKIPNLRLSPVFFSEPAMRKWTDSGVSGLTFKLVG